MLLLNKKNHQFLNTFKEWTNKNNKKTQLLYEFLLKSPLLNFQK
jgi:hypothetical protein